MDGDDSAACSAALRDPAIWIILDPWMAVIRPVLDSPPDKGGELQEGLRWISLACSEKELHTRAGDRPA